MQLQQPFDARTVEPSSFAPPPPYGDYHVRIVESEGKPTNDQTGGMLALMLEILDPGPYLNRKIPYNLNIFHKSQQVVEISYRQLSALCYVTQQFQIQDSRQLHNIPFIATIGPQKDNPQYSNVFGVKDLNGNTPGKAAGSVAAPTPPASAPAWAAPAPAAPAAPVQTAPPAWGPPAAAPPPQQPPVQAWQPPAAQPPAAPPAAPAWQPPSAAAPAAAPPWAR